MRPIPHESILTFAPRIDLLKANMEGAEYPLLLETAASLWDGVQRLASAISFASQAVALAIVINSRNEMLLLAACALFGFSVGNLITLPSLIVQREFDSRAFGVLISLITAINQITYAFGPGVIGLLRDASGSYALPFYVCIGLELTAAMLIMVRGRGRM